METTENLRKIKEFIEDHKAEFDKDKLIDYGGTALLVLTSFAGKKIVRNLFVGVIALAAVKLAYDYLADKVEETEAA